ncbi:MAG TPA: hypothetical protein VFQ53_15925 [Kofleriaceae bacterium]|nr:hypothetical protein [Kofleriaceae bacterium]
MSSPVHRLVMYRPKPGHEEQLLAILKGHGPALRNSGLITEQPVELYRATDLRKPEQGVCFVESFHWKDATASDLAHQMPEVMAVWETMGPHLEHMTLTTLSEI